MLIGVIHIAFTAKEFDRASLDALWFAGSGIALLLIGAFTLLAHTGRAVRWTAVAANVGGFFLAIEFGVLTGWEAPQGPVLAGVFLLGAVALALRR
ncbi:MAG: hypothetical protein ACJ8GN_28235 [Longimicrobiaceae bacterium]